jgi:hypothetical protein
VPTDPCEVRGTVPAAQTNAPSSSTTSTNVRSYSRQRSPGLEVGRQLALQEAPRLGCAQDDEYGRAVGLVEP